MKDFVGQDLKEGDYVTFYDGRIKLGVIVKVMEKTILVGHKTWSHGEYKESRKWPADVTKINADTFELGIMKRLLTDSILKKVKKDFD